MLSLTLICLLAVKFYVAAGDELVQDFNVLGKTLETTVAEDFKSSLLAATPQPAPGNAVAAQVLWVAQFPALNTLGISGAKVTYAPLGGNPANWHPRGTELFHLLEGELYVAIIDTRNKIFVNHMRAGDTVVIPRALVHIVFNPSKRKKAVAISSWNNQNPGISFVPNALFRSTDSKNQSLPSNILAQGFNAPIQLIEQLKAIVPNVAKVGGAAQGF